MTIFFYIVFSSTSSRELIVVSFLKKHTHRVQWSGHWNGTGGGILRAGLRAGQPAAGESDQLPLLLLPELYAREAVQRLLQHQAARLRAHRQPHHPLQGE